MTDVKTFDLTPNEAYRLVLAALDVVASVSAATHKRTRSASNTSDPKVRADKLVALVDVIESISPGLALKVMS